MHDKMKAALDASLSHLTFGEREQRRVLEAIHAPRPARRMRPALALAMMTLALVVITSVTALPHWHASPADQVTASQGDQGHGPMATVSITAPVSAAPHAAPVHTGYITPSPTPVHTGYITPTPTPVHTGYITPTPTPVHTGYITPSPTPVQPICSSPTPAPTQPPAPDTSSMQLLHRCSGMEVYAAEGWYDGFGSRITLYLAPPENALFPALDNLQLHARSQSGSLGDYAITFQLLAEGVVQADAYLLCPGQEELLVVGSHAGCAPVIATLKGAGMYQPLRLSDTATVGDLPAPEALLYIAGDHVYLRYTLPEEITAGGLRPISLNGTPLRPYASLLLQDGATHLWYALDVPLPGRMQGGQYTPDGGSCILESHCVPAPGGEEAVFTHEAP